MKTIVAGDMPEGFDIGLIVSRFNPEITKKMLDNAVARLEELECDSERLTIVRVPNATDIPTASDELIRSSRRIDIIVTLGCIIRGETNIYRTFYQSLTAGCQKLARQHQVPIINGVLAVENERQAWDRLEGKKGNRARETIDTAYALLSVVKQLRQLPA